MGREDLHLALAIDAARDAAQLLQLRSTGALTRLGGEGRDIKLRADEDAEALIMKRLTESSDLPIVSEEYFGKSGAAFAIPDGQWWVVDPLDGTMNYQRGIPFYCVSIAKWDGMRPQLGVVYDLSRNEIYSGSVNCGLRIGDQPAGVSATGELSQAILCTGFPVGANYSGRGLQEFISHVQAFKKIRMLGSAAMSLALVASGRADAYHERNINYWDIAAGVALVQAAGGKVMLKPGDKPHQINIWATNGKLQLL